MAALREPVAEAPAELPARRRMSEEEFVRWCDEDTRAEWVDGEVVVASPSSVRHVDLLGFLGTLMRLLATQRGLGSVLGPEL
jgi:Uma2 family endonuclease